MELNKLYCEDSYSFLKTIPSESVDLVLTDPPYYINYKEWDVGDFIENTDLWIQECVRILKPTGTMWSFMGYQNIIDFITLLKKYGNVHLENWVIWARQKGRGSSKHLKSQREDIIHFTKSDKYIWNELKMLREVVCPYMKDGKPRGWFLDENGKRVRWTGLGNVWTYTAPQYNSLTDKQIHPSQKPIMMLERLLFLSSNENDIILDPFAGSGSTLVACKNTNRNYIGIENDKNMFSLAKQRIESIKAYNKFTDLIGD